MSRILTFFRFFAGMVLYAFLLVALFPVDNSSETEPHSLTAYSLLPRRTKQVERFLLEYQASNNECPRTPLQPEKSQCTSTASVNVNVHGLESVTGLESGHLNRADLCGVVPCVLETNACNPRAKGKGVRGGGRVEGRGRVGGGR